jgi:predicted RNase H-like HicB family nuclease
LKFSVVVERDEDGYYVAYVPELPGCHTQARTLDELMERVEERWSSTWRSRGPSLRGGSS